MSFHRLELLRRAWRQGPRALVRQVIWVLRDRLGYHRYLVFRRELGDHCQAPSPPPDVAVLDFTTWAAVPEGLRRTLQREARHLPWDTRDWLERGWRLWVATVAGELASVSWTMFGAQCPDYFVPVAARDGVLWWTVTLPAYRGRGLAPLLYRHMTAHLQRTGAHQAYVCCGEWNTASRACIGKAGFTLLGVAHQKRRSGRVAWRPSGAPGRSSA